MNRFRVFPQSKLSEQSFDDYPVWSEHYDFDEIEEIVQWGLDRETVLDLFKKNSPGNEHCVYTLLEVNPFPERMRIFIGAVITTADGKRLKGFVVNEEVYGLAVFHRGKEYCFSKHPLLREENLKNEQALALALGSGTDIFPLRYSTEFHAKNGSPIAGEFMYGAGET